METLDFDEFMERARYHDSLEEIKKSNGCPETVWGKHGEPTAYGVCPYCLKPVAKRAQRPLPPRGSGKPIDVLAYDYHYNPDYGTDRHDIY